MSITVHMGLKISEWVSASTLSDLVSVHVCEANGIDIFWWRTQTKTAPSHVFVPVQHYKVTVEAFHLTPGNPEIETWEPQWGKKPSLSIFSFSLFLTQMNAVVAIQCFGTCSLELLCLQREPQGKETICLLDGPLLLLYTHISIIFYFILFF